MPMTNRVCQNISIVNDDLYEADEDFTVQLQTNDPSVDIVPEFQNGEATITDNNGMA